MSESSECCGSSGGCGPEDSATRRVFLQQAAVLGAGFLAPPRLRRSELQGQATASDHFVPADKQLTREWTAALFQQGPPVPWRGAQLPTIGMPCGGIAAGQLYVRGDGTLSCWWIANDTRHTSYGGQTKIATDLGDYGVCYGTHAPYSPVLQGCLLGWRPQGGTASVRELAFADFDDITFRGEYPVAEIEYRRRQEPLPLAVRAEVFSPFVPLNAADSALPATILRYTVTNTGAVPLEVVLAPFLQNPVLLALREQVVAQSRNRSVRAPELTAVVMDAVEPPQPAAGQRLEVFDDFEHGYARWEITGEAFGREPAAGTLEHQQPVSGFEGRRLVNTFRGGDQSVGTATSREFTITLPYVCFRIGGGRDLEHTVLQLLVDGQVVRRATGQERERLELQHWDVREFNGKPARLRIVDSATGPWGHVNVDWIVFADAPQRELGFSRQHPQVGDVALVALGPGVQHGADSPWMEPEAQIDDVAALRTVVADATHGDDESYESEHVSRDQAKQPLGQPLLAALLHRVSLKPGTTTTRTFAITWHFPNRRQRDDEGVAPGGTLGRDGPRVGNRYATRFGSALDVAQYLQDNQERLRRDTFAFRDALYRDTTLPGWFVQRIGMPLSTLATGVLQWWENGRAWAWEGVGCCEGTCGHVWNYAQGMARLFPELERSVREHQDFSKEHGLKADGAIGFRGRPQNRWAGDAQGGYVLKAYREHLCSPDHAFLQRNWPAIQQALEFLIREDGKEPDGLLEGEQHNTYDIEFFGPNTMVGSLYLGALKAGSRMATLIGDAAFAARCERIAQLGSEHSMARLWNGEYFVQQVDLKAHPQWQYGDGCLSDQLLGQWFADQLGLGYLYPRAAVRTALQSIWKYNWAPDCGPQMHAHTPERFFVHDGEAGLFTCTWPKSQHLGKDSVRYRDEVWSGIEYQVAAHLLREGFVTEGLAIVRGIHERYDGSKHNPYNEVECGDHYARALASWSCLLAISGFEYDGPAGLLGFAPKLTPEDFRCFFSGSDGWGTFAQRRAAGQQQHSIRVRTGRVSVRSLHLEVPEGKRVTAAELVLHDQGEPSSEPVPFVQDGVRIELRPTRELVLVPGTQGDLRTDVTLRFAD